jgi:RNA-splicing ligase RtcB
MINGKTLIQWGYKSGAWFKDAIAAANEAKARGADADEVRAIVDTFAPPPAAPTTPLRGYDELKYHKNLRAETPDEETNVSGVDWHMRELMRLPTVKAGAVMPDACPAGAAPGTIPVGGVIAAENAIHPGMHSADICCSMAVSVFADSHRAEPKAILDAGMKLSHFGGGGRQKGAFVQPPAEILTAFDRNPFLNKITYAAVEHFATQGDGNHFFYVGRVKSSGAVALVTHHGSRKPGAMLYKNGMFKADATRRAVAPEAPPHNAWIVADSQEGADYWSALQTIRAWTKANHYAIHDLIVDALKLKVADRFWNEHNFVFQKSDGLFYHAKGATPAWEKFAADSNGLTLIPLNMAQPILITRGRDAPNGLGFAPHGAGRNFSRGAYMKRHAGKTAKQMMAEQTARIDARFFSGIPDVSELPLAYKDAATVRRQIDEYGLAEVVDTIEPFGCIMAGDWQQNAPWRRKKPKRDNQNDSLTE